MADNSIQKIRRKRHDSTVKLNITSMIDMFTLMVVFLLQTYSSQGQLVTPAHGLKLPNSTIEKQAQEALSVKISKNSVMVENTVILDQGEFQKLASQKEFLIEKLFTTLQRFAEESKKSAIASGQEFSGKIAIQGDETIPYAILTKIMYTCGQAGFPQMNLIVYRSN